MMMTSKHLLISKKVYRVAMLLTSTEISKKKRKMISLWIKKSLRNQIPSPLMKTNKKYIIKKNFIPREFPLKQISWNLLKFNNLQKHYRINHSLINWHKLIRNYGIKEQRKSPVWSKIEKSEVIHIWICL